MSTWSYKAEIHLCVLFAQPGQAKRIPAGISSPDALVYFESVSYAPSQGTDSGRRSIMFNHSVFILQSSHMQRKSPVIYTLQFLISSFISFKIKCQVCSL